MDAMATAYEGAAAAWAGGAARLYDKLALAVVDAYPLPLEGRRIVDLGAGTGAVSRALLAHGALPLAVDSASDMVAHCEAHGIPAVHGDLLALPLHDASFDGAIGAFSVSHVSDPVRAMREARRVVHDGGAMAASTFAAAPEHPAKAAIEKVAASFGFMPPAWYIHFKRVIEPLTNTPDALGRCAEQAELRDVSVMEVAVDAGVDTAADIVATRLGMAHLARFVDALAPPRRAALVDAAVAAVGPDPQPLRPAVLIVRGFARSTNR
jgi:ubiquinone/menaquinone biosynthesis C-methylase UbiE